MKKNLCLWLVAALLFGLAGCTLPVEEIDWTGIAHSAGATPTAAGSAPTAEGTPEQGPGALDQDSPPVEPVAAEETQPPAVLTAQGACNRAAPGRPLDLTIPDGARLRPGQPFSKTWRLVNAGSCTWEPPYAVVWFSGERMGAAATQFLHDQVLPGQSVDLTVDMLAPPEPGVYQGNWMLSDGQAGLFGIGPSGNSAFWVRIEVVEALASPTPGALPTATATPIVFSGGEVTLYLEDWLDLDSGVINTGSADDLVFQLENEAQAVLMPANGARLAVFGAHAPDEGGCRSLRLSAEPLALDSLKEGAYLCYRSNQGLPGYAHLPVIDLEDYLLKMEFLTWSVP